LMGPEMTGDVTNYDNLMKFKALFKDEKVDLYLSDFRVPLPEELSDLYVQDPERFYLRDYLGQLIVGLFSVREGGTLIMRQYTFFTDLTIGLLAFLEDLFEEVEIVKPLASLPESPETYLVAKGFKVKKVTEAMFRDLIELTVEDMPDHRSDLLDEDIPLPPIPESLKVTEKEIQLIVPKLTFIGYRLYVLNQYPKIQINLDLMEHPRYQLTSAGDASLKHILEEMQRLSVSDEFTDENRLELRKLQNQLSEVYSEVAKRVTLEDFRYVIEETVTSWLDQNS